MNIKHLVFDLGNVLVDWSPAYLYDKIFTDKKEQDYFLQNICTMEWHTHQDGGRSIEEGTAELIAQQPAWKHHILAFYARWKEMFQGPIEGSVAILQTLKEKGYGLYALTNWSHELFALTQKDFPFLQWFDGIVVSGEVKLKKPDAAIYELLLNRYKLHAAECIFIDDKKENVLAAEALGFTGIVFTSPEALAKELKHLEII